MLRASRGWPRRQLFSAGRTQRRTSLHNRCPHRDAQSHRSSALAKASSAPEQVFVNKTLDTLKNGERSTVDACFFGL